MSWEYLRSSKACLHKRINKEILMCKSFTALAVAALLASCGGSSSPDSPQDADPSGDRPDGFTLVDKRLFTQYSDCQTPMRVAIITVGRAPEESVPSDGPAIDPASGVNSQMWWYWPSGVGYEFRWSGVVGGCEITTYSFTPIFS